MAAINQEGHDCASVWLGLGVLVWLAPRPPPTCPTMAIEVGIALAVAPVPVGVNTKLFVRLIVKLVGVPAVVEVGTVISTGDHEFITAPALAVANVVTDAEFKAAQVAVAPLTRVPQL